MAIGLFFVAVLVSFCAFFSDFTLRLQVESREQCLSACLKENEFVCRSVNYHYDTFLCELSTEDRRSKPNHLRQTEDAVDYYDNNCLNRQFFLQFTKYFGSKKEKRKKKKK